jgi:hypothetical protein
MGLKPDNAGTTYQTRLRQYQRRERMILWVGAGLAGLIGLLTIDRLSADAPADLGATTATLIILGFGALAMARIDFEWTATQLDRAIEDGKNGTDSLLPADAKWPTTGEIAWRVGLVIVPLAALVYLITIWWTDLDSFWDWLSL